MAAPDCNEAGPPVQGASSPVIVGTGDGPSSCRDRARLGRDLRLAAFEAGRAYNRLNYHLIQAYFTCNPAESEKAEEAATELGRIAWYLPEDLLKSHAIEQEICREVAELLEGTRLLEFHEELQRLEDELNYPWRYDDRLEESGYPRTRRAALKMHASRIREHVGGLWARLSVETGPRVQALQWLGATVDQGIRREDIWSFMAKECGDPDDGARRPRHKAEYRLRPRDPGQLPPPDDWSERVRRLFIAALGEDTAGLAGLGHPLPEDPGQRVQFVEGLTSSIVAVVAATPAAEHTGDRPGAGHDGEGSAGGDPAAEAGYLGLVYDAQRCVLRRQGWPGEARLDRGRRIHQIY